MRDIEPLERGEMDAHEQRRNQMSFLTVEDGLGCQPILCDDWGFYKTYWPKIQERCSSSERILIELDEMRFERNTI